MPKMQIPFTKPDITEAEVEAVAKVLRSGWITTGPVTKAFEQEIAAYLGTPKAALLASQTFAQEMVLRLLGVGPGDEVIVPAYTYTASASIVDHVGAKLVLMDAQPQADDGYFRVEPDWSQLEAKLSPRTKAVIPVDLAGICCDYESVRAILEANTKLFQAKGPGLAHDLGRVALLADTAHAFGAARDGKMAGNLADFSAFSFHAVKNLTTAEGGCVTWRERPEFDNEAIYKRLMLLSLHGQSKDALAKTQNGGWAYDIVEPLYKGNMTDLAAALGKSQFARYGAMQARRRQLVARYNEGLKGLPLSTLPHLTAEESARYATAPLPTTVAPEPAAAGESRSSYHLYLIHIDRLANEDDRALEARRDRMIARLGEAGIAANVHYKTLPMLSAYARMGFRPEDYPVALGLYAGCISLPLYSTMTDEEQDYVIEAVRGLF